MKRIHIQILQRGQRNKEQGQSRTRGRRYHCWWISLLVVPLVTLMTVAACRTADDPTPASPSTPPQKPSQEKPLPNREKMTLPPHSDIGYHANGTPSHIKGENLADHLKSRRDFQKALGRSDHLKLAYIFLEHYKTFFKLNNPQNDLRMERIESDALGSTHVRFQQVKDEIPVWDKMIWVHFNQRQAIYLLQADYLPASVMQNVGTIAALTVSDATDIAIKSAARATRSDKRWQVEDSALLVFVTESQVPRLAYGITLAKGLAQRYRYVIDAADGRILDKASLIRH